MYLVVADLCLLISSRLVCDGLLNCEKLDYHKVGQWQQTFQLIRKIIGGVDYKVFVSIGDDDGFLCVCIFNASA